MSLIEIDPRAKLKWVAISKKTGDIMASGKSLVEIYSKLKPTENEFYFARLDPKTYIKAYDEVIDCSARE